MLIAFTRSHLELKSNAHKKNQIVILQSLIRTDSTLRFKSNRIEKNLLLSITCRCHLIRREFKSFQIRSKLLNAVMKSYQVLIQFEKDYKRVVMLQSIIRSKLKCSNVQIQIKTIHSLQSIVRNLLIYKNTFIKIKKLNLEKQSSITTPTTAPKSIRKRHETISIKTGRLQIKSNQIPSHSDSPRSVPIKLEKSKSVVFKEPPPPTLSSSPAPTNQLDNEEGEDEEEDKEFQIKLKRQIEERKRAEYVRRKSTVVKNGDKPTGLDFSKIKCDQVPDLEPSTDVKQIFLSGNFICELNWNVFSCLVNLREIDLSHNRISNVDVISKNNLLCDNLRAIDLSCNESVLNLDSVFSNLKQLKVLRLNDLKNLKNIPTGLPYGLNELYMSGCVGVQEISESFVKEHALLRTLDMSNTGIKLIPGSLATHTEIQTVIFSHCEQLFNVPFSFAQTPKLRMLKLDGCTKLVSPPPAVCKQGFLAVISFMGGHVDETVAVKEEKCSIM
ncbi:hypothetical protein AKO1_012233 [Acrasis kona]|uniref:Leucine-rich repeat domain, L domain-containing protein n=1 Tax=Acrasis kona TaxID=1008807 RepID=A0AAW2Z9V1_9EUKA